MTRTSLVAGDSGRRARIMQRRVRAACTGLALLALVVLFGGCAAESGACPVPQAPEGKPEPVELAAGAVPPDDTDTVTSAVGATSLPAGDSAEDVAETSQDGTGEPEEFAASASPAHSTPRVDLVYFHTANPCGCMAEVKGIIDSALRTNYAEEMERKTVRFFSVVSDDPANQDLVRMYGSQQFDLFLVTYEGGKARATQVYEIWSLLGDNEAIALAVTSRVAQSLAVSAQPG